ncbi:MAG: Asp-tRNA(Asn)/Glu-tRNA(Gln) amidotransferase subunit GatB [Cardiobacteriaceae bacterium]|nr:Asp-tRNA(Asn)/Glu-tRNA(Gln) amidotransferase subunit GatB [Cardiobacteriaceae bacterium]
MRYEAVIGLELHIQLDTQSKLFSSSPTQFGAEPNTQITEIDLGYPGVLPVLNKQAVKYAIQFGKALNAKINPAGFFMRKNYFYPDLPKGYQISQLDDSIIQGGEVSLWVDGALKKVRINRGQLEEDAGKSVHDHFSDKTGIDLNRAGMPLIELVSEPDIRSAQEAVEYMRYMHHLVRYLGISDGNMQEGSFRCDANVSIRPVGSNVLNPRVELKNINSFRFVEQAIELEIERQSEIMDEGGVVEQETRLFDPDKMETRVMRSKEDANDYRYFPDPDLLPVTIDEALMQSALADLPELPQARMERYQSAFGLERELAQFLVQSRYFADYFDELVEQSQQPKLAANWLQGELMRLMNQFGVDIQDVPISPKRFADLLKRIADNTIAQSSAKKLLALLWEQEAEVDALIDEHGMKQNNDTGQVEAWIAQVLEQYPEQVAAYRAGEAKMIGFLTGQVIKLSNKSANPKMVNELLQAKLS